MIMILKYSLYFFISFTILCIPIAGKEMFYHLQGSLGPLAEEVINYSTQTISTAGHRVKSMGTELITQGKKQDRVQTQKSAIQKPKNVVQDYDQYSEYEKKQLEKILE